MAEIVKQDGIEYLSVDGVMFALPVVGAIPLVKEDRERAKLLSAEEYYQAHKEKRVHADHAYFLARYEEEVAMLKGTIMRAAQQMRAVANSLEIAAGEL